MDKPGNRFCVYTHTRPDTNTIFYVGIGFISRAYDSHPNRRNKHWVNIVNKNNGEFTVDILDKDLPWELCCAAEQYLISKYGRVDKGTGLLVNMTDGGEGGFGRTMSAEARKKISDWHLKNPGSEADRQATVTRNKNRIWTKEARARISETARGRTLSPDSLIRRKISRLKNCGYVIEQVCPITGTIENIYSGVSDAGRALGICPSRISAILSGREKRAAGFLWRKLYNNEKLEEFVAAIELGLSDRNLIETII